MWPRVPIRVLGFVVAALPLAACDLLPEVSPPAPPAPPPIDVPDVPDVPDVDESIAALEDALVAKLQCEELVRPSTIERMRDVLHDPTADELRALLLNPQDLASVVALGGAQVEGPVILARNVLRLVETGTAAELLENGWDGVQCGEAVTVACTAGEGSSTVTCDADAATAVALAFEGCTLGGTVYDGALSLDRVTGDDAIARLAFTSLAIDEFQVLDGALVATVGAGTDAFVAALESPDTFEAIEHGGLASGLDCATETTFDAVGLSVTSTSAVVEMKARHTTPDEIVGVETFGDHLSFGDLGACGCPLPGSGMYIDVPRPLGRDGDVARAKVTWAASSDAGLCAQPRVELEDWPTTCAGLEDVNGDCARAATASTLQKLLGALCAL